MNPAKIVLVDDNIADVKLLRLALDGEGARYELQVLPTGDEALRFVRSNHSDTARPDPCVIVLDLNMPRYDGLE
ncbi:MAG: response regulator, partial [Acidobacteriota bacterium]|nr:response regulator [Acidobacteriota bacterium]